MIAVAGASPSGARAAAIAGRSRNGSPAVATISDRTISEVGGAPSVSVAMRLTSAGLSAPSETTGFSRSMAVASDAQRRMVGERLGGDHDRRRGIGDQLAEPAEFGVVEEMRVVDDDRSGRIVAVRVAVSSAPRPRPRAALTGWPREPNSYRCRCLRTPAP